MDKVVHFEIPTDDVSRAKEFYKKVFDWQFQDIPGVDNYAFANSVEVDDKQMPKEVGAINGGILKREKTAKSPVIVINVKNIDESITKIEEAGGKVVRKKETVMDIGLYARVKDSEGNVIGVWQDIQK